MSASHVALRLGGTLALCLSAMFAHAEALEDVSSMRPLLLRALELPLGSRTGARLVGPQADNLRARTGQRSEVLVSAGPIADLPQDGCKRLDVRVRMPDVKLARQDGGPAEPLSLNLTFNLCADGNPPLATATGLAPRRHGQP